MADHLFQSFITIVHNQCILKIRIFQLADFCWFSDQKSENNVSRISWSVHLFFSNYNLHDAATFKFKFFGHKSAEDWIFQKHGQNSDQKSSWSRLVFSQKDFQFWITVWLGNHNDSWTKRTTTERNLLWSFFHSSC